jgi:hypothetical protein
MNLNEKLSNKFNDSPKSEPTTSLRANQNLIEHKSNAKEPKSSSSVYPNDLPVDKLGASGKFKSLIMKHKFITSLVSLFGAAVVVTAIVPPTIYATGDLAFLFLFYYLCLIFFI